MTELTHLGADVYAEGKCRSAYCVPFNGPILRPVHSKRGLGDRGYGSTAEAKARRRSPRRDTAEDRLLQARSTRSRTGQHDPSLGRRACPAPTSSRELDRLTASGDARARSLPECATRCCPVKASFQIQLIQHSKPCSEPRGAGVTGSGTQMFVKRILEAQRRAT